MNYPAVILCLSAGLLLSGCDSNKRHIEQVLRCGYAVDTLGDEAARTEYHRNERAALGGKLPVIDRYPLMRFGQYAREDRDSTQALLVNEYNSRGCMALHHQPPIATQQTPPAINTAEVPIVEMPPPESGGLPLLLPLMSNDA
ncbi:hypothetical protein F9C28_14595 [Shimwellia pseudoproteus]|uniref:hypothetical protein n=1 Tax=Shimwellia pseudoproteus TaxID=570012 RepID=UPI0018EBFA0F|nr:hypothetical protein [Shimwellia pseudoproteus]MBJ3816124.1 hypothetical protein [Shimwellia pseudoproteus]